MSDWPTTRRHPRSLIEAFQVDGASAIEHFRRPRFDVLDAADAAIYILAAIGLGLILAGVI